MPYTVLVCKARNSDLGQPMGSKCLLAKTLGTLIHVEKFGGHPNTQWLSEMNTHFSVLMDLEVNEAEREGQIQPGLFIPNYHLALTV